MGVLHAWQPSLFGSDAPAPDPEFGSATRLELDAVCWVDWVPAWMAGPDALFDEIVSTMSWGQRRRWMFDREVAEPRLTSSWRADGGAALAPSALEAARRALSARYRVTFDSVGVNLYRDGRDSVAWHRDRIPAAVVDPIAALLSLGSPRRFLLRPHGGGRSRAFLLGRGDLLVTGGQTQRRYDHSVPKVTNAAPRISVAFRHGLVVEPRAD